MATRLPRQAPDRPPFGGFSFSRLALVHDEFIFRHLLNLVLPQERYPTVFPLVNSLRIYVERLCHRFDAAEMLDDCF